MEEILRLLPNRALRYRPPAFSLGGQASHPAKPASN
jgi:hypothetical protein